MLLTALQLSSYARRHQKLNPRYPYNLTSILRVRVCTWLLPSQNPSFKTKILLFCFAGSFGIDAPADSLVRLVSGRWIGGVRPGAELKHAPPSARESHAAADRSGATFGRRLAGVVQGGFRASGAPGAECVLPRLRGSSPRTHPAGRPQRPLTARRIGV